MYVQYSILFYFFLSWKEENVGANKNCGGVHWIVNAFYKFHRLWIITEWNPTMSVVNSQTNKQRIISQNKLLPADLLMES